MIWQLMHWSNCTDPIPPGCPGVKAKNGVIKKDEATKSKVMSWGRQQNFEENLFI